MNKIQTRKQIISNFKQNLFNCQQTCDFNAYVIEQYFIQSKGNIQITASQANKKLAKKIFGTNYQCLKDQGKFKFCNNIKALSLIICEIAFQDSYTASLIISEIQQSKQHLQRVQNFPLQKLISRKNYFTVLKHALQQICDICQQNMDIPMRNILAAYYLGLQLFGIIIRSILIKLNYPQSCNYQSQILQKKTPQIFTIMCQYLDLNMIAKNTKNKSNDTSEIYLFTDYNLFICTSDSQEFLCGAYYQNQEELKQADQVDQSQLDLLLSRSRRLNQNDLQKSKVSNILKLSEYSLDLGMSGSGFIFPSTQQQTPFFNSNAPTPQFGTYCSQSLKLKKSLEKDPNNNNLIRSYYPIQEQSQNMQASIKKKSEVYESVYESTNFKKNSYFKENISSIIIDRNLQEEKQDQKIRQSIKQKKPKSPPTLAGKAELRIIKKKTLNNQFDFLQNNKNRSIQSPKSLNTPNSVFSNFDFGNAYKQQFEVNIRNQENSIQNKLPKYYKGSYNETNLAKIPQLQTRKSSEIIESGTEMKNFETFSKKSKLHNVLQMLKKRNKDQQISNQYSYKDKNTQKMNESRGLSNKSHSQKSYSQKSIIQKKVKNEISSNVVNIALALDPVNVFNEKHNILVNQPAKLQKIRRFSENRAINSFQSIGTRSQNLKLNFRSLLDKEDSKSNSNMKNTGNADSKLNLKMQNINKSKDKSQDTKRSIKNKHNNISRNQFVQHKINKTINIRKCPQFLRKNNRPNKQKNTQFRKQSLKNSIKMLQLPLNKKYSAQSISPYIKISPRHANIVHSNPNILDQIKQQNQINILKKSKTTHSHPFLNVHHLDLQKHQNNMSNSLMPQSNDHSHLKHDASTFSPKNVFPHISSKIEGNINSNPKINVLYYPVQNNSRYLLANQQPNSEYLYNRNIQRAQNIRQRKNQNYLLYRSNEQLPTMQTYIEPSPKTYYQYGNSLNQQHYVYKNVEFQNNHHISNRNLQRNCYHNI